MKALSAKLFTRPSYTRKDDLELLIEFANDSDRPIYISKNIAGAFAGREDHSPRKAAKIKKKAKLPTTRSLHEHR